MSSKPIQHVTDIAEYLKLTKEYPCFVKFTAPWCGPCKRIAPVFEQIAKDSGTHFKCLEVDIDQANEITNLENVRSIPLFVHYLDGKRLDNLSVQGSNSMALDASVKVFMSELLAAKPKVETVTPPTSFKVLDMSRLTLDNVDDADESDNEESEKQKLVEPEIEESDQDSNFEYGEDVEYGENDVIVEKTIPEEMIKN